jgi:hypothetical protein
MEMFPADLQHLLDTPSPKTHSFLAETWAYGDNAAQGYSKIVNAAHAAGMKLLGLDMPYSKWPDDGAHGARNEHMVKVIAAAVQGGARVVAFMHIAHAMHGGVKGLLRASGIPTVLIKLDGGVGEAPDKTCTRAGQPVECTPMGSAFAVNVRAAAAAMNRFYVPGPGGGGPDFIIHLPQTLLW